jgi:hypothetical protein
MEKAGDYRPATGERCEGGLRKCKIGLSAERRRGCVSISKYLERAYFYLNDGIFILSDN